MELVPSCHFRFTRDWKC